MLNLRIYALLICRGDPFTKASVLWDIVGDHGELYWTNPRLKHSFKLLIYFSQILPLKYNQKYSKVMDSPLRDPERNSAIINRRKLYFVKIEDDLYTKIDQVYEQEFVEKIFGKNNYL